MRRPIKTLAASLAWIFVAVAAQSQTLAAAGSGSAGARLAIAPPPGFCAFDAASVDAAIPTGFTDGVKGASTLAQFYVPCAAFAEARAGARAWLPEWVAYEVNVMLTPDPVGDGRTVSTAELCKAARQGHSDNGAPDFRSTVEAGHRLLSPAKTVVYFGVVAEDSGACYLATLKSDASPSGEHTRYLTVTAFLIAEKHWVYLSRRAHAPGTDNVDEVLSALRAEAKAFLAANGE